MTEAEMVRELAKRAGVSETEAKAVLTAVTELGREQRRLQKSVPPDMSHVPTDREINDLIAAATGHPLGLEFLLGGELCAVATMFQAHPSTVDAARVRVRAEGASLAGS